MENGRSDKSDSYTLDENNIISVPIHYIAEERGIGHQYFKSMKRYSHCVAQYIVSNDEEDTYGDLLTRCIRTSLHLQAYNLSRDDIIMLCTNNHKNTCVPFIAGLFLGLQIASLDPSLSLLDTKHLVNEVKPRIVFVIPEAVELIEESLTEAGVNADIIVFGESDQYRSFDDFLEPHEDEEKFLPIPVSSLKDPAVIFFSSGTTGLPKGIVINHYALGAQGYNFIESGNMGPVVLVYSTLYWISGVLFLTSSIMAGSARVICPQYDPNDLWHILEKYKVASVLLSPIHAINLLKYDRPDGIDTSSLWSFMVGGGSISEPHLRELRDLLPGTFVFQCYGQTEVAGQLTLFKTKDVRESLLLYYKPNSAGTPVPGMTYRVVDIESGHTCGTHQQGELRMKSRIMLNGYYNRDPSESFDSDGWLKTGDIVYFDEDLCFYVVDRIKELLKYKSWHVPPAMIEKVLLDHPAVHQCLIIGIPHEEDGDHPMAVIVPTENYKHDITEQEIERFVAERAPDRMKLRGGVRFIDALPMTPSGKVKRKAIRDMVLNGDI